MDKVSDALAALIEAPFYLKEAKAAHLAGQMEVLLDRLVDKIDFLEVKNG